MGNQQSHPKAHNNHSGASPAAISFVGRDTTKTDASGWLMVEPKQYTYTVYHGAAWYWMLVLGIGILFLCAFLAGLTLAVCGLDMAWLQMRSITGTPKQRQQAFVVARMKRRGSWMLCSLIICSVACGEYFPFVIQSLYQGHQVWVPILISTLVLAVFAEILPQYIIPRKAISWGYYSWPFIWGCMWLTSIISFPLAWILDALSGAKDDCTIFTNEQLAVIIKYHERSERRGGQLGQDAARVMLGALNNDSRRIGGDIAKIPELSHEENEKDVEKADLVVTQGMIVKWSSVRTVNIEDRVDLAFIKKVTSWSYSRIPVVGTPPNANLDNATFPSNWEGTKIFGFLHIKNLMGLNITSKGASGTGIFVKDLTLYPLPVVRDDMSVYELLNMFQLGMSRMAVVIPSPPRARVGDLTISSNVVMNSPTKSPLWTATDKTNSRIMSRMKVLKSQADWTTDYLAAAHASIRRSGDSHGTILGIRSPKPIGIITFEDLIDTIHQKTSRDEKDFFDRVTTTPPTKTRKAGDYHVTFPARNAAQKDIKIPTLSKNSQIGSLKQMQGTVRKRKVSRMEVATGAMDGPDDRSFQGPDEPIKHRKIRKEDTGDSSYTQNSRGGFHGAYASTNSLDNTMIMTSDEIAELGNTSSSGCPGNPYSLVKSSFATSAASLPSRKCKSSLFPEGLQPIWRHFSATPRLPTLRRVTPFASHKYSSYEMKRDKGQLIMPAPSMELGPEYGLKQRPHSNGSGMDMEDMHDYATQHATDTSSEAISLSSWYDGLPDFEGDVTHSYNTQLVSTIIEDSENSLISVSQKASESGQTKPYDGFPPELLDLSNKENHIPSFTSKTMPRKMGGMTENVLGEKCSNETLLRERSFHDDRALLPSQRKALNVSANSEGARSSSLWF